MLCLLTALLNRECSFILLFLPSAGVWVTGRLQLSCLYPLPYTSGRLVGMGVHQVPGPSLGILQLAVGMLPLPRFWRLGQPAYDLRLLSFQQGSPPWGFFAGSGALSYFLRAPNVTIPFSQVSLMWAGQSVFHVGLPYTQLLHLLAPV